MRATASKHAPKLATRIFLHLSALAMLIVFVSLSIWQWQRAQEKQALAEHIQTLGEQPHTDLNQAIEDYTATAPPTQSIESITSLEPYQKIKAKGHFVYEQEFLLDNIVHGGKRGYYVMTPFKLEGLSQAMTVLVNRGWLPKDPKSNTLPVVPKEPAKHQFLDASKTTLSSSTEQIKGILAQPRSKPVILPQQGTPESGQANIWLYMDWDYFVSKINMPLLPWVVRMEEESNPAFVRAWPPYEAKTGMHIGYAIQWLIFALVTLGSWVYFSWRTVTRASSQVLSMENSALSKHSN